MSDRALTKYLLNYAEADILALNLTIPMAFDALCIIPVFDENLSNLLPFLEYQSDRRIAYIWVFNCPDNAHAGARQRTCDALVELQDRFDFVPLNESVNYVSVTDKLGLFVIDRCSDGRALPFKQGVGLARKLGMDLAVRIVHELDKSTGHQIQWLHCCDADVCLPTGYFEIPPAHPGDVVSLYPFAHRPEDGYELAMALYDLSLHYYVERLSWAASPYAFHTVGSTIAVTPRAYVQVRGMPRRAAGEDFYLLNKLAKVGRVHCLSEPVLDVAGRPSQRVPFGTGPALIKLQAMDAALEEYRFYHPVIFVALKSLIQALKALDVGDSLPQYFRCLTLLMPAELTDKVVSVLIQLKFDQAFQHMAAAKSKSHLVDKFHIWFDAFKTLKFVHVMRDSYYPSVTVKGLVSNSADFSASLNTQIQKLIN